MYKEHSFSFLESSHELSLFHLPAQIVLIVLNLKGTGAVLLKPRKQNNSHRAENTHTKNNKEANFIEH